MLSLYTLPSPSSFISQVGSWSLPMTDELLPLVWLAIGITLALGIFTAVLSFLDDIAWKKKLTKWEADIARLEKESEEWHKRH